MTLERGQYYRVIVKDKARRTQHHIANRKWLEESAMHWVLNRKSERTTQQGPRSWMSGFTWHHANSLMMVWSKTSVIQGASFSYLLYVFLVVVQTSTDPQLLLETAPGSWTPPTQLNYTPPALRRLHLVQPGRTCWSTLERVWSWSVWISRCYSTPCWEHQGTTPHAHTHTR